MTATLTAGINRPLPVNEPEGAETSNHLKRLEENMTREELARNDGREGRKAYVAVGGTVYDVTGSDLWKGGDHQGEHQAGADLTEELKKAPHVRSVVERFPVVGQMEEAAKPEASSGPQWAIIIGAVVALAVLVGIWMAMR